MNKHTAKTLSLYLGGDIYYPHEGTFLEPGVYRLITCNIQLNSMSFFSKYYPIEIDLEANGLQIYPILKTFKDLTDEDKRFLYLQGENDIIDFDFLLIECIDGNYKKEEGVSPNFLMSLINMGFGAIRDKESQTGYVDLFGMPCVTPKMVEEGWKL